MENINLAQNLKEELSKGVVAFTYEKKDGTHRDAYGTRNLDIVKMVDGTMPNGNGTERTGTIPYWDMEACGWRSCKEDSVLEVRKTMSQDEYRELLTKQGYETSE